MSDCCRANKTNYKCYVSEPQLVGGGLQRKQHLATHTDRDTHTHTHTHTQEGWYSWGQGALYLKKYHSNFPACFKVTHDSE